MATVFGLTDQGFFAEAFEDCRSDLETALRNIFALSLALGDRSIFGQVAAIVAAELADVWSATEAVAASQDPDKATGASLDALCAITGTVRPAAAASVAIETLTGTPATVVLAGKQVGSASIAGSLWATGANATIVVVASWASGTPYLLGVRVTNGGNVYQCITSGTSAGSGGPTTQVANITDNTVHWRFLGTGTGAVDTAVTATVTGPTTGTSGDLTVIATPVGGWTGAINVLDAVPGRNVATDAELRLLRTLELSASGKSTQDAIRAALLQVAGVTAVTVFVNPFDTTDVNGVPPHAIEAMVQQEDPAFGADQAIRDALLANVAAGIVTHGGITGTSTDSQGITHEEDFSRPTLVPIYVGLTLIVNPLLFPTDGVAQVQAAIVAFGAAQATGKDAVSSSLGAQAFQVAGVLDVVHCFIDVAPSPTLATTIPITLRQLATYDTSRVTVSTSSGVP